jgi:hypothetical protein
MEDHTEILRRLHWEENTDAYKRYFVRIEIGDWKIPKKIDDIFDEPSTLPGWCEEWKQEIIDRCVNTMEKLRPHFEVAQAEHNRLNKDYHDGKISSITFETKWNAFTKKLALEYHHVRGYTPE